MSGTSVLTSHQPSFTEWFAAIGKTEESQAMRDEDNTRVDRLELLHTTIGLPYERPAKFPARALFDATPEFTTFLAERGSELCAIRLIPTTADLPKFRNRGLSLGECYQTWLLKQIVDPDQYTAEIYPHTDLLLWSAIFVVNADGIFGEVIRGMHAQLTQGDTKTPPSRFFSDHREWQWSDDDADARGQVARMIAALAVADADRQHILNQKLGSDFSHGYLHGYFETTVWPGYHLHFIDYNRLLGKKIATPPRPEATAQASQAIVHGIVAMQGTATGAVVIVTPENLATVDFPVGAVLVCDNTDVRFLPLMKKAGAIITNRGGLLSHAAIVARELGVPCIIGAGNATTMLQSGSRVRVDATTGNVWIVA